MSEGTLIGQTPVEPEVVDPTPDWKWFMGFAPSIGWDMAFQSRPDLLEKLGEQERILIRRPSKITTDPEKKMHCIPWFPFYFSSVDKWSVQVISRAVFVWVGTVTKVAAEDWNKSWEKPPLIGEVSEAEGEVAARALAEEAKHKKKMADALRTGTMDRLAQPARK